MDPNATLKEIREILADVHVRPENGEIFGLAASVERLTVLVSKLDGWMSGGGRLPDDWQAKRDVRRAAGTHWVD